VRAAKSADLLIEKIIMGYASNTPATLGDLERILASVDKSSVRR